MRIFWPLVSFDTAKIASLIFVTFFTVVSSLAPAVLILVLFTKYLPYPNHYTLVMLLLAALVFGLVGFWAEKVRFEIAASLIYRFNDFQKEKIRQFLMSSEKQKINDFYSSNQFSTRLFDDVLSKNYPPAFILKIIDSFYYITLFFIFLLLIPEFFLVGCLIIGFLWTGRTFISLRGKNSQAALRKRKSALELKSETLEMNLVNRYFGFLRQEHSVLSQHFLVVGLYGIGCYLVAQEQVEIGILVAVALVFSRIFNCLSSLDEYIRVERQDWSKIRSMLSFQNFSGSDEDKSVTRRIDCLDFKNFKITGSVSPPLNLKLYPGQSLALVTENDEFFEAFRRASRHPEFIVPDSLGLVCGDERVPWGSAISGDIPYFNLKLSIEELKDARLTEGALAKINEELNGGNTNDNTEPPADGPKIGTVLNAIYRQKSNLVILDIPIVIHDNRVQFVIENFLSKLVQKNIVIVLHTNDKDLIKKSNFHYLVI